MENNFLKKKFGNKKRNKIMNFVHRKEKGFQWIRKSGGPIYREIWSVLFKFRDITDPLKVFYATSFSPFYIYSLLLVCGPKVIKIQSRKMKPQTFCPVCTLLSHTPGWYSWNSFQWQTSYKYFSDIQLLQSCTDWISRWF